MCIFSLQSPFILWGELHIDQITFCGTSWWRHQMETFSALLAFCAGKSPVTGEFPTQRPVMRTFDVSFDLCLNKWLWKQSWGWWFETPLCSLWHHRNGYIILTRNLRNRLTVHFLFYCEAYRKYVSQFPSKGSSWEILWHNVSLPSPCILQQTAKYGYGLQSPTTFGNNTG